MANAHHLHGPSHPLHHRPSPRRLFTCKGITPIDHHCSHRIMVADTHIPDTCLLRNSVRLLCRNNPSQIFVTTRITSNKRSSSNINHITTTDFLGNTWARRFISTKNRSWEGIKDNKPVTIRRSWEHHMTSTARTTARHSPDTECRHRSHQSMTTVITDITHHHHTTLTLPDRRTGRIHRPTPSARTVLVVLDRSMEDKEERVPVLRQK